MYLKYYDLKEEPFGTTPDPRFLYPSSIHQEALERLVTTVSLRRGICALIAEPGLGKSTLIRTMLSGFNNNVHFAWVFNTSMDGRELLRYICRDFGLKPKGNDLSELLIELYTFLIKEYENGNNCILIIDEAQNLKPDVLEQVRQLSNLETVRKKLLQVVLSGQQQLDAYLRLPELYQLNQRISLKATLSRLGLEETKNYIRHRLSVAGAKRKDIFTEAALMTCHEIADGVPRLINQVCDNALMVGAKNKVKQIDSVLVTELLEKNKVTAAIPVTPLVREIQKATAVKISAPSRVTAEPIAVNIPTKSQSDPNHHMVVVDAEAFDSLDLGVLAIK
jgi:general secretion pathway protein A